MREKIILICVGLILCCAVNLSADDNAESIGDTTFTIGNWDLEWVPDKNPYPAYLADPRRPRMHVGIGFIDSDIPTLSSGIVNLDAGTRITVLKLQTGSKNDYSLDVEGGLFTRFDAVNALDNLGWDGRYGIYLSWGWSDTIDVRLGHRHISCHLGDEFIENTGRRRIDYTRNDWRAGLGIHLNENMLVYVEPSWAWQMGNQKLQKRWMMEGGFQYQGPYNVWKNSMAWYGGVHVASYAEMDWHSSFSCQFGVEVKRDPKRNRMRIGLEGYYGRALLGEFAFDYDESYLTLGVYFDYF